MLVTIMPIEPEQIAEVKPLLLGIAKQLFGWPEPLDEVISRFEQQGYLVDLDDPGTYYAERDGLFLVAMDGERMIGSGAIRRRTTDTAELRRLWLREEYRGQGIGYRLTTTLLAHAVARGYRRVWLQTGVDQTRALSFYEKVGFERVQCGTGDPEDVCMEMALSDANPQ
jgi:putative acetyltransferase